MAAVSATCRASRNACCAALHQTVAHFGVRPIEIDGDRAVADRAGVDDHPLFEQTDEHVELIVGGRGFAGDLGDRPVLEAKDRRPRGAPTP